MTTSPQAARGEVAVFVDLENLRYSLLNLHGQEPDFRSLVEKAKKYGRPSVMKAYADFTEHPQPLTRQLQIAGIEAINVPVKRLKVPAPQKQIERVKNAADMVLALDAIVEAVDAHGSGKSKVFLLVTGDADYVKLVTQLKHRFDQRVVVAGVPGSVAHDLIAAAGEEDPIAVKPHEVVDKKELKRAIVAMVRKGPAPLKYWSLMLIDQWCQDERQHIPGTAKEKRDVIGELKEEGILVANEIDRATFGKEGKTTQTTLNEDRARELGYLP